LEAETQRNGDSSLGEGGGGVEEVNLSSGNDGQVVVVFVFSAQAQLGVVVDLESKSGISVDVKDTTDLESVRFVVVGSVRELGNIVVSGSSVSSSQEELA